MSSLLGPKIEAARKKKKLSQAKLADMLGVSRASVSLYETSAGHPSYKVLGRLAEVLSIPFVELAGLGDGGDDYPGSMITQQILHSSNDDRAGFIKYHLNLDEKYTEVEFMSNPLTTLDLTREISSSTDNKHVQWPSISVLVMPGEVYDKARVYIVKDNKMGLRYPEGSRHILHPIEDKSHWQYLTGLHGISLTGSATIIRRITSNKANVMTLADAAGNEIVVPSDNISMLWRVGQTIHMPAEN